MFHEYVFLGKNPFILFFSFFRASPRVSNFFFLGGVLTTRTLCGLLSSERTLILLDFELPGGSAERRDGQSHKDDD